MSIPTMRFLALLMLSLWQLPGGQTLKGNVSSGSTPSLAQIYSGQDPLKGSVEYMPPESTGKCDPPIAGWRLVYQSKTTCYYFAPFRAPLQGIVINPNEAGNYPWAHCSAHPWDPTLIICYGKPKPAQPGRGRGSYSGIATIDPCHPQYDMSTAQGRAMAVQMAAQTKQACDDERCKHNPDLEICGGVVPAKPTPIPDPTPTPTPGTARPAPTNPVADKGNYVQGLVDGLGDCIKSFGDLLAGAAFFAKGDFVNAALVWGLTPGQSVTLKTIAAELSQPVIGSSVTPHLAGRIAGRRICNYALVPGLVKAGGALVPGIAKAGGAAIQSRLPKAPPNPIAGNALLDATTEAPAGLAGQVIDTARGPVQLGEYVGGGTFGRVYRLVNKPRVIKLGTRGQGSAESFPRQVAGSHRLEKIGVDTPKIYDLEPGTPNQPAALIMDDVKQRWPGAKQYTAKEFGDLPAAEFEQVKGAVADVYRKIAESGHIAGDLHINNMMFRSNGAGGLSAIIHDADMIMTGPEMQAELLNGTSIPGSVVSTVLEKVGLGDILSQPITPSSMMNALYKGRFGGGLGTGAGGSGTPPAP